MSESEPNSQEPTANSILVRVSVEEQNLQVPHRKKESVCSGRGRCNVMPYRLYCGVAWGCSCWLTPVCVRARVCVCAEMFDVRHSSHCVDGKADRPGPAGKGTGLLLPVAAWCCAQERRTVRGCCGVRFLPDGVPPRSYTRHHTACLAHPEQAGRQPLGVPQRIRGHVGDGGVRGSE